VVDVFTLVLALPLTLLAPWRWGRLWRSMKGVWSQYTLTRPLYNVALQAHALHSTAPRQHRERVGGELSVAGFMRVTGWGG
jgi:hypothetical protein